MKQGSISSEFIIKSYSANKNLIKGYASVFGNIDSHNDSVIKGAFKTASPENVKFLWQHDSTKPIGIIKSLEEDHYGLKLEAEINTDTIHGKEAVSLIKQKALSGLSIGFAIKSSDYNEKGERIISDVDLMEISVVTFPSNKNASICEIKNQSNEVVNKMQNYFPTNNLEKEQNLKQKAAFDNFIRKGIVSDLVTKSFSSDENEAGVLLTSTMSKKIISNVESKSVMRNLASVESISTRSLDLIIEDGTLSSGWVSETDERVVTDTSKLIKKTINTHEIYSQPKATQSIINDSEINIERWLTERISNSFAILENEAFLKGDGNNKPFGLLQNSQIEKINAGDNITVEILMDIINKLDDKYLSNASFLMNRNTLSAIQSLKDNTGRFIWQQSLSDPLKQTIFGIPVVISSNMPDISAGNLAIACGDFKSAYKIVDRSGISLMRDPYTEKPFVKFYSVKRVGGDVINPDAMKFAQFSK